jgi:hypothetical protein
MKPHITLRFHQARGSNGNPLIVRVRRSESPVRKSGRPLRYFEIFIGCLCVPISIGCFAERDFLWGALDVIMALFWFFIVPLMRRNS